jgi:hypothetical protein
MSPEFERAFPGGGGCFAVCNCGREFFDASGQDNWDWAEGEFEALMKRSESEPDKCIGLDQGVGTVDIGGLTFVYDCPCKTLDKYERFLTSEARNIVSFLNARAARLLREAEEECEATVSKLSEQALAALEVAAPRANPSKIRERKYAKVL